jgi:hypothetical protein
MTKDNRRGWGGRAFAAAGAAALIAAAGLGLGAAPRPAEAAAAKAAPAVRFDPKDLQGIWLQDQGVLFSDPTPKHHSGSHPGWDDSINPPPLLPELDKVYKARVKAELDGGVAPNPANDCAPPGMPRLMANPFRMEVVQKPGVLYMLFEFKQQIRRVYLDGRPHPGEDDFDRSYNGHSIAKWEGDTLVVDTIYIRPDILLQVTGIPLSEKMHVIERIKRVGPDKIEDEITMIDPGVFTKPWVAKRSFTRQPPAEILEYICGH